MWIAIDPDNARRRAVFGDEERAHQHAEGLVPAWAVLPADDPQVVAITGIWPDGVDQQ